MNRETILLEEADAWFEYLETCRTAKNYEEIEGWAWSKLQMRLKKVGRLVPVAA